MSKLTTAIRKKLPKSVFGLPGDRSYPMPDKSHAANAKARASQQVKKGKLTPAQKKRIDAKANKVLGTTAGKKSQGNWGRKRPPKLSKPNLRFR